MDEYNYTSRQIKKSTKQAGLFFFLLMIMEIPAAVLVGMVQDMFSDDKSTLVSILITQGYLLLCAVIYILVTRKSLKSDFRMRSYRFATFWLSLLVLIVASPMSVVLNLVSQLFVKNEVSSAIFDITKSIPPLAAILVVGCLPGFIEELIYRGIMYSAFRKYSILAGAIVSAVSFGLMHLNFNQIPYAIYLGLIFAFMVEATGSLFSTMIMHMIFNAVNTCYLFLLPQLLKMLEELGQGTGQSIEDLVNQQPTKAQIMTSMAFWAPGAIIGVLLVILLIRKISEINGRTLTWDRLSRSNADDTEENGVTVRPVNIWLILGWIFCIVFSILNM